MTAWNCDSGVRFSIQVKECNERLLESFIRYVRLPLKRWINFIRPTMLDGEWNEIGHHVAVPENTKECMLKPRQ